MISSRLCYRTGAEARMQAINYHQCLEPSRPRSRFESLLRQINCALPSSCNFPLSILHQHNVFSLQMLRDGAEGSEVAEMGRPQDLMADPTSLCVWLPMALMHIILCRIKLLLAAHAESLSDSTKLWRKVMRSNAYNGLMMGSVSLSIWLLNIGSACVSAFASEFTHFRQSKCASSGRTSLFLKAE
jgi:hypothetical protein